MLLNEQLIDKLMRNKTLVGLMSNQLKRVINTNQMDEPEKRRIVRQVFEQMMEKRVDFSMSNVRLAVKTVSSSYKAAAAAASEKSPAWSADQPPPAPKQKASKGATAAAAAAAKKAKKSSRPKQQQQQPPAQVSKGRQKSRVEAKDFGRRSASLPVIDTALKLTKSASIDSGSAANEGDDESSASSSLARNSDAHGSPTSPRSAGSGGAPRRGLDSSGNPIVVVLLPTEKKA